MKNINLLALEPSAHLVQPEEFNEISLDSPARKIFTDFKKHKPLVIEVDTPASDVLYLMKKAHVRMQLVVDADNELVGTISHNELNEQGFLVLLNKGYDREQITVRDLMIPRADIKALHYKLLDIISISELVHALKQHGMQHCLVIDPDNEQIRGIISATDIARRLHIPLEIEVPKTFVDIFVAVNAA
jgi:CBS domain containing-hemolysin-like protein